MVHYVRKTDKESNNNIQQKTGITFDIIKWWPLFFENRFHDNKSVCIVAIKVIY